jgi:hypothetical protein
MNIACSTRPERPGFLNDRRIVSKVDGAYYTISNGAPAELIEQALNAQTGKRSDHLSRRRPAIPAQHPVLG